MNEKTIKQIGVISTPYKEKFGIPRQSKRTNSVGEIYFEPEFNNIDAFREIESFTHLWIIFGFNKAKENTSLLVRPPRLGGNKKVGVFASRSPFRPNTLGLSSVRLKKLENRNGKIVLVVSGVDLLDGTPIYDIKPYIPSTDSILDAVGGYAENFTNYKLQVVFPKELQDLLNQEDVIEITESLKEDPRPSYQKDGKEYGMKYKNYNVKFTVSGEILTVLNIEIL